MPGGFGVRGTQGMIEAVRYARENRIPFFGICLGMQMASVEFARNVAGLEGADSTEFEENPKHRIIFKLRELVDVEELGGTMRLGAYPCVLTGDSQAAMAYGVHGDQRAPPAPLRVQPGGVPQAPGGEGPRLHRHEP